MAQNNPFEIPQQLRDLAERNVEQARNAYAQFMDAMGKATGMWAMGLPPNQLTSGFKDIQDKAIKFANENAEAGFALAKELAKARDVTEIIAVQSKFAQSQMQTYAKQAQEIGKLLTDAAGKAKG